MANITLLTGDAGAPGPTSEPVSTSNTIALGTKAVDASGNMWAFVNFTGTVYGLSPVNIQPGSWTAAQLATTGRGPVGVSGGNMTSDQLGWVQVYGRTLIHLGMSGVSPSDAANGPTTVNTSLQTVFVLGSSLTSPNGVGWVSGAAAALTTGVNYVIEGMYVADDVSVGDVSATTSATSHPGNQTAVFLNFPYIRNQEVTS
jgi:hypothetical protein